MKPRSIRSACQNFERLSVAGAVAVVSTVAAVAVAVLKPSPPRQSTPATMALQ